MHSLILTVHNKGWLLGDVLDRIKKYTSGPYELIAILDGCSDNSEEVLMSRKNQFDKIKVLYTPDVFETKANNTGLKASIGDYNIIIQDDMLINEHSWNLRMQKPFDEFGDVFAVTARTAHNWIFNPNSVHIGMQENLDSCWCDICLHVDHAEQRNIHRDVFAVRNSVNRGPLMIDHSDLEKMNYLDEAFMPQDMDDHDLCYRMHKKLNKVVGCYWIDFISDNDWGGTRENGQPAKWLLKAHHKNMKIFWERHQDLINKMRIIDNRKLS
tara:strand:+ start:630 stop:1436 length:807 start_codon:yes stop_codon:yes gene_type:complete